MEIKATFLGGAGEVGKSSIMISDNKTNIMLDYGVKLQEEPVEYPLLPREKIDVVIPSHAHLDHSGAVPILFKRGEPKVIATDLTLELSYLLLNDSLKISKKRRERLPFSKRDLKSMMRNSTPIRYRTPKKIGGIKIELFDAGHIPGSASILMSKEKKIFYTGDIKMKDSRLLNGCSLPDKTDVLIIESTYGDKKQPKREDEEKKLKRYVREALTNNDIALIPTFAVGRAQEILLVLEEFADFIAIDGMAKQATEIIYYYKRYIKNSEKLKKIMKRITWVRNMRQRKNIIRKGGIVLTTAGMLGGGPIIFYLQELHDNPKTKILFSGFLVEDTPGYNLLKTGVYSNEEMVGEKNNFKVKCEMHRLDFSAHADREELLNIIKKLSPKKVICVHGDNPKKFAKDVEEIFNIDAFAPKIGEEIVL
ncbi:MAG: MBL fold metallo-hydrolase [Candidatus Aenigmatarchaeota archaeon]|nr:MAG: MBL fold metallo-hydrolase [Candidatus Aenigmarchaeota archaeon]